MRDWREIDDRRAATLDFRDFMELPANAEVKKKCCGSPTVAKQQFAIHGKFYIENQVLEGQPAKPANVHDIEIPESVQFKVYDSTDEKGRNDSVVIVLPSSWGDASPEPTDIWIAAWPQWKSKDKMIAHLEARLAMLRQEQAQDEK